MAFPHDAVAMTSELITAFGQSATHCPKDGGAITTVTVVFDRPSFTLENEIGSSIHYDSSCLVASATSASWQEGDTLTIESVDYLIASDPEPDGDGETFVKLRRAD